MRSNKSAAAIAGIVSLFAATVARAEDHQITIAVLPPEASEAVQGSILSDGTLLVDLNGLVTSPADADAKMNWNDAMAYCENLNANGHEDWYLPDENQLEDLNSKRQKGYLQDSFANSIYWSSTIKPGWEEKPLIVYLGQAAVLGPFISDKNDELGVRCIRHDESIQLYLRPLN